MQPSRLTRLIPLALCLALVSCGGSDEVSAGPSKAAIADADVAGLFDMQGDLIDEVADVLADVESESDARSARSSIEALADRAEALARRMDEVKGQRADDPLAFVDAMGKMKERSARLMTELERLEGVSGVREQLEEPMDRLFETMKIM